MKRYFKRIASLVLASGMMLSAVSSSFISSYGVTAAETAIDKESEVHIWDGTSDVSWYDEEETEFHISTAEQLAGLSEIVNTGKTMEGKTFILDNDIYLNDVSTYDEWETTPPENTFISLSVFSGEFQGDNHSIIGIYGNELFRNLKETIVAELHLEDLYIRASRQYIGGLSSYSENALINDCSAQGVIHYYTTWSTGTTYYIGGIVGASYSGRIINCTNAIDIFPFYDEFECSCGESYMGGICGYSTTDITNCVNNGKIISDMGSTKFYAGGICGGSESKIRYCKNCGEVESTWNAAGICALNQGIACDCYNTGNINKVGFGGGTAYGSYGICDKKIIKNTYNTGKVSFNPDIYSFAYAIGKSAENSYYLTGTASKGTDEKPDTAIVKSEPNLKKESFADSLGEAFYYVEGSYPKLAFEVGRTISNFDKTSLSFKEFGETQTLTLDTTYLGEPEWVSSDTSVATVDADGVVTAVGNGTAMIYALCSDSKAACSVSVGYDYYLSDNELTLKKGRVHNLSVFSASTGKEVTDIDVEWCSSDDSIVSVDSEGTITTNAVGTAAITAKLAGVELSCIVVIYEYTVPITPVEDDKNAPKLSETDFTISTIESKLLSVENYSESITLTSANTSIAKVSKNGLVKGVSAGNTAIYALLSDGRCLKANAVITESEYTMGDVNLDGEFNVSDVVLLQKWLLAVPDIELKYWENADFYEDGKLNVFDLCLMKRQIINAAR